MDKNELMNKIRGRIEQCRRLARYVNDPRTTDALLQMADEGEADLRRLEQEGVVPPGMIQQVSISKTNSQPN